MLAPLISLLSSPAHPWFTSKIHQWIISPDQSSYRTCNRMWTLYPCRGRLAARPESQMCRFDTCRWFRAGFGAVSCWWKSIMKIICINLTAQQTSMKEKLLFSRYCENFRIVRFPTSGGHFCRWKLKSTTLKSHFRAHCMARRRFYAQFN